MREPMLKQENKNPENIIESSEFRNTLKELTLEYQKDSPEFKKAIHIYTLLAINSNSMEEKDKKEDIKI